MKPTLEVLEDRTMPDATIISPAQLLGQMQLAAALDQQAYALIQATFQPSQTSIIQNITGMIADSLLLSQVAQQMAQFLPAVAQIAIQTNILGFVPQTVAIQSVMSANSQ